MDGQTLHDSIYHGTPSVAWVKIITLSISTVCGNMWKKMYKEFCYRSAWQQHSMSHRWHVTSFKVLLSNTIPNSRSIMQSGCSFIYLCAR